MKFLPPREEHFDSRASLSRRDELCIFEYHGTKLALESIPSTIMFAREHLLRAANHCDRSSGRHAGHDGEFVDGVPRRLAPGRDRRQDNGVAAT